MKLQLALDTLTIPQCLEILAQVGPDVDIIEIGTPLIIREGLEAVRIIRQAWPDKLVLADLKIADAGAHEARLGFDAGADIVTVLGAVDDQTIREAIQEARRCSKQVMVDMIGLSVSPLQIDRLEVLAPDLICVHNAVDRQAMGRQAVADLAAARPLVRQAELAVAGGVNPGNVETLAKHLPDVVVVGSGITSASDPKAAAHLIRLALDAAEQSRPAAVATTTRPAATPAVRRSAAASLAITDLTAALAEELAVNLRHVSQPDYQAFLDQLSGSSRLFVAGAGRSGLVARAFAMRLMHLGRCVYVVGEIVTPAIGADDTLLILSGSGETASLVQMARKAKACGARLLLVTIQPTSTLGQLADTVLRMPGAAPKAAQTDQDSVISILPMGSLFEQSLSLLLEATVIKLMVQEQAPEEAMFARHANLE
jgi:3-hexulose-6-phosphate synthase/6-phospho 3-hexuloisomerase